jgi:hypothetical protein
MSLRLLLGLKASVKTSKERSSYISATEFDNFINNDLVCDWLFLVLPKKVDTHPLQSLFNKGIHHEAVVIDTLRKKLGLHLPKLSSLSTSREYDDYTHACDLKESIIAMKRGDSLIYSPFIASEKQELRGIPDLLVRSDFIQSYFGIEDVPQENSQFGRYYYIPIEIKYSSLHADKTGKTLLNVNRTKMYKTQLCVYSQILADIQGVFPCCAFIIGKGTDVRPDPFTALGHVYFQTRDEDIVKLFYKGLDWLRDVRANGHAWDFSPKLLPNMKVSHPLYDGEKKKIADYFGEITDFWQCSVKHRLNLLDRTDDRVHSWRDPQFDPSLLGVNAGHLDKVTKLFQINRGELGAVYPKRITHDLCDWRNAGSVPEIFVDFETVGNPDENEESTIFLIGVWHKRGRERDGAFVYTPFVADAITPACEQQIVVAFHRFWTEMGRPKVWHWCAEEGFWAKVCKKYNLDLGVTWTDLYKVFFDGDVMVKGCKNFKLKSYVNALVALRKINIELPPSDCCSGMDALCLGMEYYESRDKQTLDTILAYNAFDCKSLHALLGFIRKEM